jgi:acetyl-CoA carboxylase alpha subunit
MLRAGVGFASVMQLLGHLSPEMTLQYLEITQQDLQREFQLALSHPRHLVPTHTTSSGLPPRPDLSSLIASLMNAQHVLEMYRRMVDDQAARRLLGRLANRIVKILAQTRKLNPPEK